MLLGKNKKADSALLDEPVFYDGVGADLCAARERGGLSIADVSADLKIQGHYLAAIEAGEFEKLPGPAYAVGFVQSYANLLGLDDAEAVSLFKQETSGRLATVDIVFPQPLDESRRSSPLLIVLILMLVAGGYGGWVYVKRSGLLDPQLPKIQVPKSMGKKQLPEKKSSLPATFLKAAKAAPGKSLVDPPRTLKMTSAPDAGRAGSVASLPLEKSSLAKAADPSVAAGSISLTHMTTSAAAAQAAAPTAKLVAAPLDTSKKQTGGDNLTITAANTDAVVVGSKAPDVGAATGKLTTTVTAASLTNPKAMPAPMLMATTGITGRTPQIFGAANKNARVVVIAHRKAWIQVKSRQNELLLARVLYPGDQYHAPNRQDLLLTVGNAGAIEIRVDGKAVGSLGGLGVVRRDIPLSPERLRKVGS